MWAVLMAILSRVSSPGHLLPLWLLQQPTTPLHPCGTSSLGSTRLFPLPRALFLYWLDPSGYKLGLLSLAWAQPLGPIPSQPQTQSEVNSSIPGNISTTFSFTEADVAPGDTLLPFGQNELE